MVSDQIIKALERSREYGFLGVGPIDRHVAHAQSFIPPLLRGLSREVAAPDAGSPIVEMRSGDSSEDDGRGDGRLQESADLRTRILDLGSGGGLPGLVLADLLPNCSFVLLDANQRRTEFLEETVSSVGWGDRVEAVRLRAEEAGRHPRLRGQIDAVTARSFGSPPVVCECAAPFLRTGGVLVVSEPPRSELGDTHSSRWPAEGVSRVGLEVGERIVEPFGLQVLTLRSLCPDPYPRRTGVPTKRPLFSVV